VVFQPEEKKWIPYDKPTCLSIGVAPTYAIITSDDLWAVWTTWVEFCWTCGLQRCPRIPGGIPQTFPKWSGPDYQIVKICGPHIVLYSDVGLSLGKPLYILKYNQKDPQWVRVTNLPTGLDTTMLMNSDRRVFYRHGLSIEEMV
jgi:hypothetical protein